MAMDFIKSCTTNVQILEDATKLTYKKFRCRTTLTATSILEQEYELRSVLRQLRKDCILATSSGREIWVFDPTSGRAEEVLEQLGNAFEIFQAGAVEEDSSIEDKLLEAIESGITYRLASEHGLHRVGDWLWAFPQHSELGQVENATALRIRANFATDGTLQLATLAEELVGCVADNTPQLSSKGLILSPSGRRAQVIGVDNLPQTSSNEQWRTAVRERLECEGIHVEEEAEWLSVQLGEEGRSERFTWPASLCFVGGGTAVRDEPDESWMQWFSSEDPAFGYHNPLGEAERWMNGPATSETVHAVPASAEQQQDAAFANDRNGPSIEPATSPPFTQRTEQQSVNGIYPTPPDGMVPFSSSMQANPEAIASVATHERGFAPADSNVPVAQDQHEEAIMREGDDSQPPVRLDRGFSLASSAGDANAVRDGHDELFGDMEGMDFGGEEVGDADFSFFDEPDAAPSVPISKRSVDAGVAEPTNSQAGLAQNDTEQVHDIAFKIPATKDGLVHETPVAAIKHEEFDLSPKNEADSAIGDHSHVETVTPEPEKPLSPFSIRERILPPPIPASMKQQDPEPPPSIMRRRSSFAPVNFNEAYRLPSRYTDSKFEDKVEALAAAPYQPSIRLPPKRKKSTSEQRLPMLAEGPLHGKTYEADSDDDSYESEESESDADLPPILPWESKKRRRNMQDEPISPLDQPVADDGALNDAQKIDRQSRLLLNTLVCGLDHDKPNVVMSGRTPTAATNTTHDLAGLFSLTGSDITGIAQLVSEQSLSNEASLNDDGRTDMPVANSPALARPTLSTVRVLVEDILHQLLAGIDSTDLSQLAAVRDIPTLRPLPQPSKGQPPRPPPRVDTGPPGPDIFSLTAPFVRVQRGDVHWELLPPALTFWEPLGLGPASGTKDVRAFCVYPSDIDVETVIEDFLDQLGASYESCKLGAYRRKFPEDEELDDYPQGMAIVHIEPDDTPENAFKHYAEVCIELGTQLASISGVNSDSTIAIHIVNPFQESRALHALTACFWLLYKAYVDANKLNKGKRCSDIVLQVLPINTIANFGTLVVPGSSFLSSVSRELYDRCPPTRDLEYTSPLAIAAAPAVELATAPPKRIQFQLVSEAPRDLLHEGSVLHMAYAYSDDKEWICVTWVDSSGRYSTTASFCLRGKSFASIASDMWERVSDIITARQVSWRIFIVAANVLDSAEIQYWRSLIAKPRQHTFNVTLLSAKTDNELQFFPPTSVDGGTKEGLFSQNGFLTPATTPQASSFGVSPEANSQPNAPPTPAPSEPTTNPENEPDAHLVDTADDCWGALLQQSKLLVNNTACLATGVLVKRGDATKTGPLPCLTVSLHWTVQVRASAVEEGVSKRGEMTLKEVLGMYRNLGLLTRARGLADNDEASVLPWHMCTAMRGAKALNGFIG